MIDPFEILDADILIVDGQPANVRSLEGLLSEAGYARVSATMSAQEAVALQEAHHFDLILLDPDLPGMDSFQVLDHESAGHLPVIVLTAQPAHDLGVLPSGAKDFISRPFDRVGVRTRIRNMLEMRLLHRKLARCDEVLEQTVRQRTAELHASEDRFRRLTELASDWYWEQDERGNLTQVSGPAMEMLGIRVDTPSAGSDGILATGWNEAERAALQRFIAAREPFLDFVFRRIDAQGSQRQFRVSGEPMFNPSARFTGYRGIGVEFDLDSHPPEATA